MPDQTCTQFQSRPSMLKPGLCSRHIWVGVCAASLTFLSSGCGEAVRDSGSATDPTGVSPDISTPITERDSGEMSSDVDVVERGHEVNLSFAGSLAELRGGYFLLIAESGERVAGLWSDRNEEGVPGFTLDLDNFEILAFGVTGPGPDRVLIPEEIEPGQYQICTANSDPESCVAVTIL